MHDVPKDRARLPTARARKRERAFSVPRIDGWEVIRVLRNEPQELRRHIIAMSGFADPWSRERAFAAGCDQYIVKESGTYPLVSAVQTYCARAFA